VKAQSKRRQKAPYAKPRLRAVALVTEEVLTSSCKTSAIGGPEQGSCLIPSSCLSDGS